MPTTPYSYSDEPDRVLWHGVSRQQRVARCERKFLRRLEKETKRVSVISSPNNGGKSRDKE